MKKYIIPILSLFLVAGSLVFAQSDVEIIESLRLRVGLLKKQIELIKQKQVFGSAGQTVPNAPINGIVQGGTTGSMLFVGTDQKLTQDNANIFYDDTNNRLGIGTTSPSQFLAVDKSAYRSAYFAGNVGIGTSSPNFLLAVATTSGGTIDYINLDGTSGQAGGEPRILWTQSLNTTVRAPTAAIASTGGASFARANLSVSVANQSRVLTERFRIDSQGRLGYGTTSPNAYISIDATTTSATSTIEIGTLKSTTNGSCIQMYSATGTPYRIYIQGIVGGMLQVEAGGCQDPNRQP